jgi:glycosyltransferase involved in cell wall biosynthesis
MGRYTLSLLKTLCGITTDFEYCFIFSSNLERNSEAIKAINALCPEAKVVELNLRSTDNMSYKLAAAQNRQILNAYLNDQATSDSARDVFMIPCLFQEPTASTFPEKAEKCLLYYDAIPLLYYERYKNAINYDNYLARHKTLFDADRIFTISQTIADDLAIYYGIKNDNVRVINIDGACIDGMFDTFKRPDINPPKHYILFPTSDDIRKNNFAAVRAFDQLRTLTQVDYKLVITSSFREKQRNELLRHSSNLIFTGNISDHELAWLYKHAEVVLFASEYEGLGLPVLEAVKMGKKVACSNIPVFREISEEAFYFFDPLDIEDITLKLYRAIKDDRWAKKQKLYATINEHYSWPRSAKLIYDAIKSLRQAPRPEATSKPRLAILAPTPDGYSAIGKVVQELHAVTARYFDVHYYFEDQKEKKAPSIRPNYLEFLAPCFDVVDFNAKTYKEYDAVLYHIGNSEYHLYTILNALYLPGIAVFHDTVLREAFGEMVRLGFLLPERLEAEAKLDNFIKNKNTAFLTSLVNNQLAALVHSDYAYDALKTLVLRNTDVSRAELPVELPVQNVQSQRREAVHIGLAGILGGRKGLDIIKELALDNQLSERAIFHVFGFSFVDPESIKELRTYKNVRLMTNLSDLEYQMRLANLDILVNYRSSYRGETSLTVLEAMRYGCVVVVNGELGWFSELPDEAVVKVKDQNELIESVRRLVSKPGDRHHIGNAAKQYVKLQHDPDQYIHQIRSALDTVGDTLNYHRSEVLKNAKTPAEVLTQYKKIGVEGS